MSAAGRTERAHETREAILDAAERLFAEHSVGDVSNRQIGLAAGQANNFAVGYHFGTKADLARAIVRRYTTETEGRRLRMLAQIAAPGNSGNSDDSGGRRESGDSSGVREAAGSGGGREIGGSGGGREVGGLGELRDWVGCLVRPATDHLDALGVPCWRARCLAQFDTVPALRRIVIDESVATPSMRRTLEGMFRLLPGLPEEVHRERSDMSRLLVVHTLAERERALHEGGSTARTTWEATAIGLIDALAGLWLAPVSTRAVTTGTE